MFIHVVSVSLLALSMLNRPCLFFRVSLGKEHLGCKFVLAHGTIVRAKVIEQKFKVVASAPLWHKQLDKEIPLGAEEHIEQTLGITFKSTGLSVSGFTGDSVTASLGDLPTKGWAVFQVNEERVCSQEEIKSVLRRWAHIHSITFTCTNGSLWGPLRDSQEQVDQDLEWLRPRCIAQANIVAELAQLFALLRQLHAQDRAIMKGHLGVSEGRRRRASRCDHCQKCASRVAWVTSLFRCASRCDPYSAARLTTWLRDP